MTRAEDEGRALVEAAILVALEVRKHMPHHNPVRIMTAVMAGLEEHGFEDHDAVEHYALNHVDCEGAR